MVSEWNVTHIVGTYQGRLVVKSDYGLLATIKTEIRYSSGLCFRAPDAGEV
jgi:hypothetical protein